MPQFKSFTVITFEEKDSTIKQVGVVIDYIINRGLTLPRILFKGDLLIHSVRQESITPVTSEGEGWIGLTELASYYEHKLLEGESAVGQTPHRFCKHCGAVFRICLIAGALDTQGPFAQVCEADRIKGGRE